MRSVPKTIEIWKPIPGFPDYEISSYGGVKRIVEGTKGHPPKILKPSVTPQGYPVITLFSGNGAKRKQISRMVCEAFHGAPPSSLHQAAHNDGDPGNNHETNLRWATRKENMADCLLHGTRATGSRHGRTTKPEKTPRGEKHGRSRLTEAEVLEILAHPKSPGSGAFLSRKYKVSTATICVILKRKTWRHL